ncbi:hypothetical protein E1281_14300 [Actinomadura sp. KC345]|uniref:hypothetical protein n=1 Tax=Actinomadura sp. KC345 TaxID=2530371 RepID=UPI0010503E0A|nr:hypothetical protein [Actinomadura sp. KC345]TDC55117.1 hypothetical protein E1281_14300 [Actinomadura sp. KC345]
MPTPPLNGLAVLTEIAASGPRAAWAAGLEDATSGGTPVMLAWDGRQWRRQALPPGAGQVVDLAAAGPRNAWGIYLNAEGSPALHWDGTKWRSVGYPAGVGPTQPSPLTTYLEIVSAAPRGPAWSVGYDSEAKEAVALRYTKGRWTRQRTPVPMVNASTVAVRSAKDVWIACTCDIPGAGPTQAMLHWDGSKWSTIRYPSKADTYIAKIVPVSATSVWAYRASTGYAPTPELMHWDGTSWTSTTIPVSQEPGAYHYPTLADDGDQGAWVSMSTRQDDKSYLHYSGGRWTAESGAARPGISAWVHDLARVPGTRSIWSAGMANPLGGPHFIERRR